MSQSAKDKKSRVGHRTYTRKLVHRASEQTEIYDGQKQAKIKLDGLKRDLTEKLKVLEVLDNAIADSLEDEKAIEAEIDESSEFRSKIHEVISQIDVYLQEKKPKQDGGELNVSLISNSSTASSGSKQSVRLPKLSLKHFKGDPIKFQAFWDSFETTIHNNEDVSDVNKMSYLVSLLDGQAYSAIAGLALTSANYKLAVDTLKERFGSEEVVISAHMDALLKLPAAGVHSDTKKIRGIFYNVEQHVRGLETIGMASEQYGKLLVPILMSKIPQDFQLIITRKLGKNKCDLNALLKAFKEELEAREMCQFVTASRTEEKEKQGGNRKGPSSAEALLAQGQEQQGKKGTGSGSGITCTYCRGAHPSAQCHVITDVKARKEVLKGKGSERGGHTSQQCQSLTKCYACGYRHHINLCTMGCQPKSYRNSDRSPSDSSPQNQQNTSSGVNHTATVFSDTEEGILLQTATVEISNPRNPEKVEKARILFDSGSQKTYISKRLRDALSLSTLKLDRLIIKTFGSTGEMVRTCEEVQLCVKGNRDLNLYLTAHCVPVICAPLQNQTIEFAVREFPHLADLELADYPQEDTALEVDLLVRSDFYWQFMTGGVKRGESGPTAMESRLGWILSGPSNSTNVHSMSTNLVQTHVLEVEEGSEHEVDPIQENLTRFWSLDSMGIQPSDEHSVHKQLLDEIKFDGQRYQVKCLFKQTHPMLPNNYQNCAKQCIIFLIIVLKRQGHNKAAHCI